MALVEVDSNLQLSEEVADFMLFMINEDREIVPRLSLPEILLAKTRPGLNSEILTASVVSRFPEAGIPTGPLIGGATNVMELYTKILIEEIVDAIQTDLRVDVAVDAGLLVNSTGANGAGPVVSIGNSITPHTGIGIAR